MKSAPVIPRLNIDTSKAQKPDRIGINPANPVAKVTRTPMKLLLPLRKFMAICTALANSPLGPAIPVIIVMAKPNMLAKYEAKLGVAVKDLVQRILGI